MTNPEMGPQEPEEEKEQTPEEILAIINEAIEKGGQVLLTQENSEGKTLTNIAIPYSLEGNFLTVEAGGYGFDIRVDSIKKAELFQEEKEQAVEENEALEMSPEDFQEMLAQLPIMEADLENKKEELESAEAAEDKDLEKIAELMEVIELLENEIVARKEIQEESDE